MKQNVLLIIGLILSTGMVAQMALDNDLLVLEQIAGFSSNSKITDIEIVDNTVYTAGREGVISMAADDPSDNNNLKQGEARSLKITKSGKVVSAFANNILYVDNEKIFQVDSYDPLTNKTIGITDIEEYGDQMYVATNDGILVFDLTNNTFVQHLNKGNSKIPSNSVNFLLADSKNRLWIGTDEGIIHKKSPSKDKWSPSSDKTHRYLVGVEQGEDVWIVSDDQIYNVDYDARFVGTLSKRHKKLYEGDLNDLAVDKEGNLYIASDILVKFNPYTGETIHYTDILSIASQKCTSLVADDDNNIWLGTGDAGLFRITSDPSKRESLLLTSILEESISCPGQGGATIKVAASGGLAPYSYQWTPAYVKGDNPSGLKPGKYQVNVVDARGTSASSIITVEDAAPIRVNIVNNVKASSASTRDGKCDIEITGGESPYQIQWDNGEKGASATKLNFGFHYITITDANNCTVEEKINVSRQSEMTTLRDATLTVGEKLRIENLYFAADSSAVQENSIDALEDVFIFLTDNDGLIIEIGGHTNNIPKDEYCDRLSEARAKSVSEYLIRRGIPQERISYKGYGKRDPIATNNTVSGRKRNQRVEMKILAITN